MPVSLRKIPVANHITARAVGKCATRYTSYAIANGVLHETVVTIWPSAIGGWFIQKRNRHFGTHTYSRTSVRSFEPCKRIAFARVTGMLQMSANLAV